MTLCVPLDSGDLAHHTHASQATRLPLSTPKPFNARGPTQGNRTMVASSSYCSVRPHPLTAHPSFHPSPLLLSLSTHVSHLHVIATSTTASTTGHTEGRRNMRGRRGTARLWAQSRWTRVRLDMRLVYSRRDLSTQNPLPS